MFRCLNIETMGNSINTDRGVVYKAALVGSMIYLEYYYVENNPDDALYNAAIAAGTATASRLIMDKTPILSGIITDFANQDNYIEAFFDGAIASMAGGNGLGIRVLVADYLDNAYLEPSINKKYFTDDPAHWLGSFFDWLDPSKP